MIRDAEAIRKKQGKKPNVASKFLGDLIEGSDDLFQAELYGATKGGTTNGNGSNNVGSKEETKSPGGGGGGGSGARVADEETVDYIPPPRVKSLPRRGGGGVSIADYDDNDEFMFGSGPTSSAYTINSPTIATATGRGRGRDDLMGRDELDDGYVAALNRPPRTAEPAASDYSIFSFFSPRL